MSIVYAKNQIPASGAYPICSDCRFFVDNKPKERRFLFWKTSGPPMPDPAGIFIDDWRGQCHGMLSPVTGDPDVRAAWYARSDAGACGPNAKFFSRKIAP